MKTTVLIGIALIVAGAAVLGYGYFSYTSTEEVLKIGPLSASAEKTNTVSLPPLLGWLLVGGGLCAIFFGSRK